MNAIVDDNVKFHIAQHCVCQLLLGGVKHQSLDVCVSGESRSSRIDVLTIKIINP
jgi:hypothetical protein